MGIDVFGKPFDKLKGWSVYANGKIKLLVLKLEMLDTSWQDGYQSLFPEFPTLNLLKANVGSEKSTGSLQETVKRSLRFPAELLEKIYDQKTVKHFYDDDERRALINSWSL